MPSTTNYNRQNRRYIELKLFNEMTTVWPSSPILLFLCPFFKTKPSAAANPPPGSARLAAALSLTPANPARWSPGSRPWCRPRWRTRKRKAEAAKKGSKNGATTPQKVGNCDLWSMCCIFFKFGLSLLLWVWGFAFLMLLLVLIISFGWEIVGAVFFCLRVLVWSVQK